MTEPRFAAVDIGSNIFRLIIYKKSGDKLIKVESYKKSVKLAADIDDSGKLSKAGMEKAVSALKPIAAIIEQFKSPYKAVATHAVRAAKNFEEVIDMILKETGLTVDIIDGVEEARMIYKGICLDNASPDNGLLIDVGGGSTEISVIEAREFFVITSINIGTISTQLNFLLPPSRQNIKKLKSYLVSRLFPIALNSSKFNYKEGVLTSGTAKTIAKVLYINKGGSKTVNVHGFQILPQDLQTVVELLLKHKTPKKIAQIYDIDTDRAELLLAGTLLIQVATEIFLVEKWSVSSFALREGLAQAYFSQLESRDKSSRDMTWFASITELGKKFGISETQGKAQAEQAMILYEAIRPYIASEQLLMPDIEYSRFLTAAAYLMNIGKYISYKSHHKHAYYIIANSNLMGFNHQERHLIGLIIRYARKNPASEKQQHKKPYLKDLRKTVNYLGGYLRVTRLISQIFPEPPAFSIQQCKDSGTLTVKISHTDPKKIAAAEVISNGTEKHLTLCFGKPIVYNFHLD